MNVETFNELLAKHVKSTIIPQLEDWKSRFAVGAAIGAGVLRVESMEKPLRELGVLSYRKDEATVREVLSEIDVEKLRDAVYGGFEMSPEVSYEKFGRKLTFKKSDAEAFFRALGVG